jgi:FemAB-related protein (PEP-CTERM system-associated)
MITITECHNNSSSWDNYVNNNQYSSIYHRFGWKRVIEKTFNHSSYFIAAEKDYKICGVLPLFLIKSRIFGSYLVSLPFIDSSGILADTQNIASLLCKKAIELSQNNQVDYLELRNPVKIEHDNLVTATHKANFILPIAVGPDFLWKKVFHENIRNKVRKAIKSNLYVELGNDSYFINNFYNIFSNNMRYLGTPVYSKNYFVNIVNEFPQNILIFLVYLKDKVIGGKVVLLFRDTVYFIYHSSTREYAKLAPNNLLYWRAIEYACQNGYAYCNMGRSNKESGPYNFKKQWGGEARQLYWQYYLNKGDQIPNLSPSNPKFSLAIDVWKRLPLWLTQLIGPQIAKYIP